MRPLGVPWAYLPCADGCSLKSSGASIRRETLNVFIVRVKVRHLVNQSPNSLGPGRASPTRRPYFLLLLSCLQFLVFSGLRCTAHIKHTSCRIAAVQSPAIFRGPRMSFLNVPDSHSLSRLIARTSRTCGSRNPLVKYALLLQPQFLRLSS